MEEYIPRLAGSGLEVADWISIWSGLGGAVLGALIGGLITWLLAHQAAKDGAKRDIAAITEDRKAKCLRLMVKASVILSDVAAIQRGIDESLEQANQRGLTNTAVWQRVLPIVGSFNPLPFDADEAAALMAINEYELAQNAIELFGRHENFLIAVRDYSEKRQRVADLFDHNEDLGGGRLSSIVTNENRSRVTPHTMQLESLVAQIRETVPDLRKHAEDVTFGIGPAVRKKLHAPDFPIMVSKDAP